MKYLMQQPIPRVFNHKFKSTNQLNASQARDIEIPSIIGFEIIDDPEKCEDLDITTADDIIRECIGDSILSSANSSRVDDSNLSESIDQPLSTISLGNVEIPATNKTQNRKSLSNEDAPTSLKRAFTSKEAPNFTRNSTLNSPLKSSSSRISLDGDCDVTIIDCDSCCGTLSSEDSEAGYSSSSDCLSSSSIACSVHEEHIYIDCTSFNTKSVRSEQHGTVNANVVNQGASDDSEVLISLADTEINVDQASCDQVNRTSKTSRRILLGSGIDVARDSGASRKVLLGNGFGIDRDSGSSRKVLSGNGFNAGRGNGDNRKLLLGSCLNVARDSGVDINRVGNGNVGQATENNRRVLFGNGVNVGRISGPNVRPVSGVRQKMLKGSRANVGRINGGRVNDANVGYGGVERRRIVIDGSTNRTRVIGSNSGSVHCDNRRVLPDSDVNVRPVSGVRRRMLLGSGANVGRASKSKVARANGISNGRVGGVYTGPSSITNVRPVSGVRRRMLLGSGANAGRVVNGSNAGLHSNSRRQNLQNKTNHGKIFSGSFASSQPK